MMQTLRKIYHLVLFLFIPLCVNATNYYVDKNASGSNNGTSWADAWQSFSVINWSLIDPGDIVYISGGPDSTIYYEQLYIGNVQGTAANPITVIAGKYAPNPTGHNGRVIIDGMDYPNSGSIRWPIYMGHEGGPSWGTEYITLKGLESRGGQAGVRCVGIANVITFDSLTIYHFYDLAGIYTEGVGGASTFDGIDSVTIRNCDIRSDVWWGQQTDGIYIKASTNTVIHDNFIWIPNQDPYAHVDGIQSQFAQGFVIYNNVIINDSVYSPEGGGMPIILRAANAGLNLPVIIYNNFCYMGGAWMPGANNGIVVNLHSGDQAFYPAPKCYVFHNTIVGNGPQLNGVGLDYFGAGNDGKGIFHNNIVAQFGSGAGGISWLITFGAGGAVSPIHVDSVKNNLFYKEWGTVNFAGKFTNGSTTASGFNWNYWTGTLGGSGIQADPKFINNIGNEPDQSALRGYLQEDSPAINQGEDVSYLFDYLESTYGIVLPITDIDGNSRNLSNPTIGAYEYDSGPDLTPPEVTDAALLDSVTLVVTFSEALNETTAEDENNYSISNNIDVFNASLSGRKVTLQTSPHLPGINYTVTVINVEDLAGNVISPQANSADYEYIIQLDVTPPELVGVQIVEADEVVLDFSEPLDPSQISNLGNYVISEQMQVLNAELNATQTRICLTTEEHLIEHIYNIQINNLTDLSGNVISSQANSTFYKKLDIGAPGYVEHLIEYVDASATTDTNTSPQKTLDGLVNGDPDPNSRWAAEIMPQWIQFDLGEITNINLIATSFYQWNAGRIYEYSIQISNDENNWNEIVSNASSSSQEWTFNEFSPVLSARYVRIICESNNQANWAGVWEARIFEPDYPTSVETEPHTYALKQNYPNPFNPSTIIDFSISEKSFISLSVFNAIGQEVAALIQEEMEPGAYKITFNAANLPSGIYFYRLQSANFVKTRKMVLMK